MSVYIVQVKELHSSYQEAGKKRFSGCATVTTTTIKTLAMDNKGISLLVLVTLMCKYAWRWLRT